MFKYLGVWNSFNDSHIGERELNYRINCAKGAFAQHRKMLQNNKIAQSTRTIFLNGLVRSRLTYGCHAWRPTQLERNKLSTTYNHFLRSMISNGFKRINPPSVCDTSQDPESVDWSYKIFNVLLFRITKMQSLEDFYHSQQKNWIAHVVRRENSDIVKLFAFHVTKIARRGRPIPSIMERAIGQSQLERDQFLKQCFLRTK